MNLLEKLFAARTKKKKKQNKQYVNCFYILLTRWNFSTLSLVKNQRSMAGVVRMKEGHKKVNGQMILWC